MDESFRVVVSTWGRFHSFHLARQLERFGWLEGVLTTYPWFKLKNEGIAREKVFTNPWIHTFLMAKWRYGLRHPHLDQLLSRAMYKDQQHFIARKLQDCNVYIGLSGSGVVGGRITQQRGGKWICDRSSSHILYADEIMAEEFARFGQPYTKIDPYVVQSELQEYDLADRIVVPSEFVRQSFIEKGVPESRLAKIPFGSDLSRFHKVGESDPEHFTVCFCGQISLRKGIPDLLSAFRLLRHPKKHLILVGTVLPEVSDYLRNADLDCVEFAGQLPQPRLAEIYSRADVFAMASIEEGMAVVQAEAMACGLPVVATFNAGATDLVVEGHNGFIVPIRRPDTMAERLQNLADDRIKCRQMGENARHSIALLGGWNAYGDAFRTLCLQLTGKSPLHAPQ